MVFKSVKSLFYTRFGYFLFIFFLSIANEDKIEISFDKIFPTSILESFHKLICHKKNDLKNMSYINQNKEEYLESSIDSIIDFHVYIHMLKDEIKRKRSYFKEDLENLIFFMNQMNNIIETNLINYDNSKKEVVKILFDKAISRLSNV